MDEAISLANKLGGAGFATLLLIILYGNWRGVWVWDRDVVKLVARYEALLLKAEEDTRWWRSIAVKATGIAELQGTVAKELAKKNVAENEDRKS